MSRILTVAFLYAALMVPANHVQAAGLSDGLRAELEAVRSGDMRKLLLHETPRYVGDSAFLTKDGAGVNLSDSNGKVRLLNFWATWCAPCRVEKPTLDALNKSMSGDTFEVFAIATGKNTHDGIKRFNKQIGIESLATYLDPQSSLARELGVLGLPVTVLVDADGYEIGRVSGAANWNTPNVQDMLRRIISAQ